jgi:MerR family copper efflux transcriptional regulator
MSYMNIGDAATAAGVTPKMIRHYEGLGLIPEPERTEAGYRLYGDREVAMLRFIRQSRGLGFSMKQIEELMALWRDDSRESREVKEVALRQLAELDERQSEIDQMRGTLSQLVAHCAGDHRSHCAILDTLARPAETTAALKPARTLKEVRAGEKIERPRAQRARPAAQEPAHAGLMAWARGAAMA